MKAKRHDKQDDVKQAIDLLQFGNSGGEADIQKAVNLLTSKRTCIFCDKTVSSWVAVESLYQGDSDKIVCDACVEALFGLLHQGESI